MQSEERAYWLALHSVPGLGSVRLQRAVSLFGSAQKAWIASAQDWMKLPGLGPKSREMLQRRGKIDPHKLKEQVEGSGVEFVTLNESGYPPMLRNIYDPPPVLFFRGQLSVLCRRPCVAVVGTRRPGSVGRALAYRIARDLAEAGVIVVSGLARGIDTEAHCGSLAASSGAAAGAVLGSGLSAVYPPENRSLAAKIERRGVVVSEYFPRQPAVAANFPARNRIISGLSLATLVVEAGIKSGALITARFALEQGREVFAVPRDPHRRVAGGNELIRDGAGVATSAADILEVLGIEPRQTGFAGNAQEELIVQNLQSGPRGIDDIAAALDLPVDEISLVMLQLELRGLVRRVDGDSFVAAV